MNGKIYQKQNGVLTDITPNAVPVLRVNNIGELVYSLLPIEDAGLHLLDGAQLSASGAYSAFVSHVTSLQTAHPNLFATEADWQASVNTYGVCGKFVVGSGTLRLPKVTGHIAGTIDPTAIGDLIEAGLPNITGDTGSIYGTSSHGCFKTGPSYSVRNNSGSTTAGSIGFDASLSSSIYGNSDTVQPQAIKGFIYMVVANRVKTPIVSDIDQIAADLNLKAGVDLGNVTSAGQVRMAHAAMPSGQYIDLTLPTNGGTVTAPADGWLFFGRSATGANQYLQMTNVNNYRQEAIQVSYTSQTLAICMPVSSGSTIKINYTAAGNLDMFAFIYANGSAS